MIELLDGKWEPAVLMSLSEAGQTNSAQLRRAISRDLSFRMLRDTADRLEAKTLLERIDHAPSRDVEYQLTANGQRVCILLHCIDTWAGDNADLVEAMERGSLAWAHCHHDSPG